MKKYFILLLWFVGSVGSLLSQTQNFGLSAGLSFSFGNKVKRIGLRCGTFYTYAFTQINASVNTYYNFKSLAIRKKTPELQLALGAQLGFGKQDSMINRFVNDNLCDWWECELLSDKRVHRATTLGD